MRVRAQNNIRTPVGKLLGEIPLGLGDLVAVLHAPVNSHHHEIGQLTRPAHLLFHHIPLAGVDDIGRHGTALRDAIGVVGVGEVGNRHTVYRLQGDGAIITLSVPPAGRDHIFRHLVPEPQRCCNTFGTFIVGVVVGKTEHLDACPVKSLCAFTGGRKAGIGGRLQFLAAERFLVDPVYILRGIKIQQVLVAVVKIISLAFRCPAGCLFVDGSMDQIVPGGRKTQCGCNRLRFRFGRGNAFSGRRLVLKRAKHDAGSLEAPEAQAGQCRTSHQQHAHHPQKNGFSFSPVLQFVPRMSFRGCSVSCLFHSVSPPATQNGGRRRDLTALRSCYPYCTGPALFLQDRQQHLLRHLQKHCGNMQYA